MVIPAKESVSAGGQCRPSWLNGRCGNRYDIGLADSIVISHRFTPLPGSAADAVPAGNHLRRHKCLDHAHHVVRSGGRRAASAVARRSKVDELAVRQRRGNLLGEFRRHLQPSQIEIRLARGRERLGLHADRLGFRFGNRPDARGLGLAFGLLLNNVLFGIGAGLGDLASRQFRLALLPDGGLFSASALAIAAPFEAICIFRFFS